MDAKQALGLTGVASDESRRFADAQRPLYPDLADGHRHPLRQR
jgi:hypothetical protein